MNKDKVKLENLCLKTFYTIDLLRTQLFENESFNDFQLWDKRLKNLKKQLNDIYWNA